MNIDPRGLTVKTWCDFMVTELIPYGQAPFLQDERMWKMWAENVRQLPGLSKFNPPSPLGFQNFYDWAERFNQTVRL